MRCDSTFNQPHDAMINQPHDAMINQPHDAVTNQPHDAMINQPHDAMTNRPHDAMTNQPHDAMRCSREQKVVLGFVCAVKASTRGEERRRAESLGGEERPHIKAHVYACLTAR